MSGKGDKKRPCLVSREEESLRWRLLEGEITREEFDVTLKRLKERK